MLYLLDTNAISEPNKPQPDKAFLSWFQSVATSELYVSCITVGELFKGVELQKDFDKKQRILTRTNEIIAAFGNRVLPVTLESSQLWAQLIAHGVTKGRSAPVLDAYIAAHAIQHQLTLVTRNVRDFEQFTNVRTLCPWDAR